jgi:hypothetical protein
MGPADRELLGLVLSSDLDSGDVAAITGQAPSAVYVKVSRLKDALGRSAGALLVARHHREDCADLDALLATWDGAYAPVWRKRIARHVDDCEVCGSSRTRAAAGLFSLAGLAPLAAVPLLLRDRAVDGATRASTGDLALVSSETALDLGPEGFAVAHPWEPERDGSRRSLVLAAAAALLLVVGGGAVALAVQADAPPTRSAAASLVPLPTAPVPVRTSIAAPRPSTAVVPTTSAAPTPTAPAPAASLALTPTATPVASVRPATAPTAAPTAAPTVTPTTAAPLTATPAVALRLSETAIGTSCGAPTTSVATATASGTGALTTRISWDGTAPGSREVSGTGAHAATVGPYAGTVAVQDVVTVTAVVTDALGRTATDTQQLTVSLAPC